MIGHLSVGPGPPGGLRWSPLGRRRREKAFWVSAAVVNDSHSRSQNHYAVLGISRSASPADIKKAYRSLARKWHPDVSKDSRAGEVFKSIHLAYQVLSDEATRVQYDRMLNSYEYTSESIRRNEYHNSEFDDEMRRYRWSEVRKKMRKEEHQRRYYDGGENFSFYTESDDESEDEMSMEERGSFTEVLESASLFLFLVPVLGCQIPLVVSSLRAFFDKKLDFGYKLGYWIAVFLGGRGGVLLSLCLSFASWACGKNNSSMVALVFVAMWVGSNITRYALIPQGALLALLYMSVKLQSDMS